MERIPVFLSSDNNYAMATATTIKSCIDNTESKIDFYILSDGISNENQQKILSLVSTKCAIEFISVDNSIFHTAKTDSYVSPATYARLLIPQIKPNLKKVIYSDVDVLFTGDISELYNEKLDSYIIGACKDAYYVFDKTLNNIYDRLALHNLHNYMYAGMLLIDCDRWREERITEKIFGIMSQFQGRLAQGDQDLLNICFNGNQYKELDIKYEVTNGYLHFYEKLDAKQKHSVNNPVIRHYESRFKPWNSDFVFGKPMRNVKEWFDCARSTDFLEQANILLHSANISFVVHGEIERETNDCLDSIRHWFPESEIILSTYKNRSCNNLKYDQLIQIEDDIIILSDCNDNFSKVSNIKKLMSFIQAGLHAVSRKYVFVIRSDFILKGNNLGDFFGKFPKCQDESQVFNHKILCTTLFFCNQRVIKKRSLIMPFNPNNAALFGFSDDVINMFDSMNMAMEEFVCLSKTDNSSLSYSRYISEQQIWLNYFCNNSSYVKHKNNHPKLLDGDIFMAEEMFFVSNFISLSFEQFSILTPKKFITNNIYVKDMLDNCITHIEWQKLYQYYLDNMLQVPQKDKERRKINLLSLKRKAVDFITNIILIPFTGDSKNKSCLRCSIRNKLNDLFSIRM